jgi:5-methylcytosine-specific restriction enzyme A
MALTPCLACGQLTGGSYCPGHRPRNGSTRQWRKTRTRILTRDHGRCQRCGNPASEVDHIRPVARGGSDHPANLEAICRACNLAKSATEGANRPGMGAPRQPRHSGNTPG